MLSGTCTMLLNYSGCIYQRNVLFVQKKKRFASFVITLWIKTWENRHWLHPILFQFLQQDVAKRGTHKSKTPSQDSAHNVHLLTTVHTILNKITSCSVSNASCFTKDLSLQFSLFPSLSWDTLILLEQIRLLLILPRLNHMTITTTSVIKTFQHFVCIPCTQRALEFWWYASCCFLELQSKTGKTFHSNNRMLSCPVMWMLTPGCKWSDTTSAHSIVLLKIKSAHEGEASGMCHR